MVWITIEVHIDRPAQDGSGAQLDLWPGGSGLAGAALPHPSGGTHWQRMIRCQPPGVPLKYGRPEM